MASLIVGESAPFLLGLGRVPFGVAHLVHMGDQPDARVLSASELGEQKMRVLLACAIVLAVGLGGCFHHQQAVTSQPISAPPLK